MNASLQSISKRGRSKFAWLWLCYTGFLFIDPIVDPSLRLWLGTLAVFCIFLAIFAGYIRTNDETRPLRGWWIVATFLLAVFTFPWNAGAITFFVYTAAFLPFVIVSVRRVLGLFVVESLLVLAETWYFHLPGHHSDTFHIHWSSAYIAIFLLLIIGGGNILFAEQRRADCKLRLAQEENLQLAAVAERERIARDLHDVLGHTLSVIVLKAELARRLIERDPARAMQEIAEVESTARTALAEVRETIGGFRSHGLPAELDHARRTLDAAGVVLTCEPLPATAPALSATEETVLTLSVREAVTNIVRHAEATRCTMRLVTTPDGYYSLLVEDDGPHTIGTEGNGLRGMRERVSSLGGRFSIRSENGTHLLIEIPIASTRATTQNASSSEARPALRQELPA